MRGGGHHFFVYPKGWVITFLVSTKGGSCVFARCFAGGYGPPSGRNNERSLKELTLIDARGHFVLRFGAIGDKPLGG